MQQPSEAAGSQKLPTAGLPLEDARWRGVKEVFVQNLPARISQGKFLEFVRSQEVPQPDFTRFPVYGNGKCRGYAIVGFKSSEAAYKFVIGVSQQHIPGFLKEVPLVCTPCERRPVHIRSAIRSFGLPAHGAGCDSQPRIVESRGVQTCSELLGPWLQLGQDRGRNKIPPDFTSTDEEVAPSQEPLRSDAEVFSVPSGAASAQDSVSQHFLLPEGAGDNKS
mmetsp:Transcript_32754/g.76530  ORF Transcript_32754/g.76530 Transcript_32754/m.76530 type:complete len:221 (+) Transcript_32754:29-691(+)